MGDAAEPRGASSAFSRTWQLILAPWSEAQRAALRRFGNDESSVLLFALRTDGGKLEVFFTCKTPRRAAWLSTHVIEGECRLKQALIRDKRADTLYLLPAAQTRDKNAVTPEDMKRVVAELKAEFDFVIINVDFPEPEDPINATYSFFLISNDIDRNA
jgi:MinD-like ATPase involved in chromosome partitioning or flagellar assembly